MIQYTEDRWWRVLVKCNGSVLPAAFQAALPSAIISSVLVIFVDSFDDMEFGSSNITSSQIWAALVATLSFLIAFRTNKAYGRFWDGTTLLHQVFGEWYDASSCLIAFTSIAKRQKPDEVNDFRQTLVRLMSFCHASAMEEISNNFAPEDGYPVVDLDGLDESTLLYLYKSKFDPDLNFNRVEVLIHMIQTLIVHHSDNGVLKIPPPILSRVFQTLSRGQVNLANCKKIVSTYFPFPYAQLIAVMQLGFSVMTPIVMSSLCRHYVWSFFFTFVPVFGLRALNYVARELEMPFGDDPNDLPLLEFQDHMNTALIMLIREETDHVPHLAPTAVRRWMDVKAAITEKRPSTYNGMSLDDLRKYRVSVPPMLAEKPSAAPAAPKPPPPTPPTPATAAPAAAAVPVEITHALQDLKASTVSLAKALKENTVVMSNLSDMHSFEENFTMRGTPFGIEPKANGSRQASLLCSSCKR